MGLSDARSRTRTVLATTPVRFGRLRIDRTHSSLLFDGQRIQDNQTAEDLDMEDGDVIEVLLERELRVGSCLSARGRRPLHRLPLESAVVVHQAAACRSIALYLWACITILGLGL